jgi:hypothetical protein
LVVIAAQGDIESDNVLDSARVNRTIADGGARVSIGVQI